MSTLFQWFVDEFSDRRTVGQRFGRFIQNVSSVIWDCDRQEEPIEKSKHHPRSDVSLEPSMSLLSDYELTQKVQRGRKLQKSLERRLSAFRVERVVPE